MQLKVLVEEVAAVGIRSVWQHRAVRAFHSVSKLDVREMKRQERVGTALGNFRLKCHPTGIENRGHILAGARDK